MIHTIDINGIETPVEFPDNVLPEVKVTGNQDSFVIDYGNGLVKVGGIVTITTLTSIVTLTNGSTTEGSKAITFPVEFTNLLDYQCSALDNNTGSVMEHAHLGQVTSKSMNLYASHTGSESKQIQVKWFAEGVI